MCGHADNLMIYSRLTLLLSENEIIVIIIMGASKPSWPYALINSSKQTDRQTGAHTHTHTLYTHAYTHTRARARAHTHTHTQTRTYTNTHTYTHT